MFAKQNSTLLSDEEFEKQHIWHPYDHATNSAPTHKIISAKGVTITTEDGTELIDAMSSWWCMIHGYNHSFLNTAIKAQVEQFSHLMYGGLSHQPAIDLARRLLPLTPQTMHKVFFSDSGSVAVEVAMKMALQFYSDRNQAKNKFLTIRSGYHGDTWRTMSVSDPDTGMHSIYKNALPVEYFVSQPPISFRDKWHEDGSKNGIAQLRTRIDQHHNEIAAVILEPIAQGAGGMYFYHPEYLNQCREICNEYDVLLIFDEIATGFGRTGKLFATEHTNIEPDILCLGKALTGGYLSMAATLCSKKISDGIADTKTGVLMHGPTFMANPLACSVANASLQLLIESNWFNKTHSMAAQFLEELSPALNYDNVSDVRTLGGIGVIEMKHVIKPNQAQPLCKKLGVWLRPFGKCIYAMPPYIATNKHISKISNAMLHLAKVL